MHAGYKLICPVVLSCSKRALSQLFVPLQGVPRSPIPWKGGIQPFGPSCARPLLAWSSARMGAGTMGPPPPPAPSTAVRLCTRRAPSVCTRSWGCCSRPGRCAGKWHSWPLRATGKCEGEVKRHRPSGCHFSLVWCCAAALTALWLLWPCSVLSSKARSRTRASTFDKVQRVLCVTQACI